MASKKYGLSRAGQAVVKRMTDARQSISPKCEAASRPIGFLGMVLNNLFPFM